MKIKRLSFIFSGLMLALVLSSFTAFAALPAGTVVIGDKAYDLNYANDSKNQDEISSVLTASNGKVYVKGFDGNWIDNVTSLALKDSEIPSANTYNNKPVNYISNGDPRDGAGTVNSSQSTGLTTSFQFTPNQTVSQGQSLVDVGNVTLSDSGCNDVKITGLKIKHSGLSKDSSVGGIGIWNGSTKISLLAIVSDGIADISFASPITISDGQSKTLTIKMNVDTAAEPSSQIILEIPDKNSIKTEYAGNINISGTFPAVSGIMTVKNK